MSTNYQSFTQVYVHTGQKYKTCNGQNLRSKQMANKLLFNIEQKLVTKTKTASNKKCRSSHKELRSIEFAFFRFFYEFISNLQHYCLKLATGKIDLQKGP